MKKFLLIIAISVVPFLSMAQNTVIDSEKETKVEAKTEVAIKKVEPIRVHHKTPHLALLYQTSNDIISIKAYIESLPLKRKATLNS